MDGRSSEVVDKQVAFDSRRLEDSRPCVPVVNDGLPVTGQHPVFGRLALAAQQQKFPDPAGHGDDAWVPVL